LLTRKSGASEKTVREVVSIINHILTKEKITAAELTDLNRSIEKFQQKK
jgi:ferritin-like metal-binding protein YciE